MSTIDHLTRFLALVPIPDKSEAFLARVLVKQGLSGASAPDAVPFDHVAEFENNLVNELQAVFELRESGPQRVARKARPFYN